MASFSEKKSIGIALAVVATGVVLTLVWRNSTTPNADSIFEKPTSSASHQGEVSNLNCQDRLERATREPNEKLDVASLRAELLSVPKIEASAAIVEFLRSGRDQSTGLEFEIGPGGEMKSWPTLRTMLLDLLESIDPVAAAAISREILGKPTTADEWAIALRNLGRGERNPENDAFLVSRTVDLINRAEWQEAPSVGYLNAFDVLVHLGATAETPLLSSLVQRKERKDLAHAAFLTMDRLVQRQPADMLARLSGDSALQQVRPEMTAQQFARADLRDPQQRDLVKSWLLEPSRTSSEIQSFVAVFPNQNRFVSHNLLTDEITVSGAELVVHDREALQVLQSWNADPAFEPVREHLQLMTERLQKFVQQASETQTAE